MPGLRSARLVRSGPLAQQVLSFLEDKIVTRELTPGTRLVEDELSEQYGISRTPLREALRQLEASSLVVRKPGHSVHVAPMTLENLNHVFACRVPLEGLAAAMVAGAPPERRDATIAELDAQLALMAETLARGDSEGGFRANVELTHILHRDCGNPVLAGLLAQLDKPALRYRHWAYVRQPQMLPMAVDTNAAMIAAIREGDAGAAGEVTRSLVRRAWTMARESLAEGAVTA
jgi:DNA-binding GntR family transcriptional regulator